MAKIKEKDLPEMVRLYRIGMDVEEIAERYGVTASTVYGRMKDLHVRRWRYADRRAGCRRTGVTCFDCVRLGKPSQGCFEGAESFAWRGRVNLARTCQAFKASED